MTTNHIDIQGHLRSLLILSRFDDFREIDRIFRSLPVSTRTLIIRMIMAGGDCGDSGLQLLAHLTRDACPEVRSMAFITLARYEQTFPGRIVRNVARIQETDPWVELFRIRFFLACDGTCTSYLLDAMRHSASFPQRWVQREAIRVLKRYSRVDKTSVLNGVISWLSDTNWHVRETAARFIHETHGQVHRDVFEALCRCSRDPSHLVRRSCAIVLSNRARTWPEAAVPHLKSMAADPSHWSVRLAVLRGLSQWYDVSPGSALEIIKPLVRDPIRTVRSNALRQLRRLARFHPALTLFSVRRWHHAKETDRQALTACLEEVSSEDAHRITSVNSAG